MKRPIKFRGQREDTKEWIYGSLLDEDKIIGKVIDWNEDYFNTEYWWRVIPETVGQFTGLYDKNGTEIYEGDIVVGYGTWNLIVSIEKGHTVIKWTDYDSSKQCVYLEREWINGEEAVVIGNIHDNKETL